MTRIIGTKTKFRRSAKITAGLVISAILAVGTFSGSADARGRDEGNRHGYGGNRHGYNGGYYRAPPVVYGSRYGGSYYGSYYNPPPVVINLGGIGIGIR